MTTSQDGHEQASTSSERLSSERVFARLPNGPRRRISARPVSSFLPNLTKKIFQKQGFSSAALATEWAAIVGEDVAGRCQPERMVWPRRKEADADSGRDRHLSGATLVLRTDAAFALETQYAGPQIIDRINAYLGYRAVAVVKIAQGPLTASPQTAVRGEADGPGRRPTNMTAANVTEAALYDHEIAKIDHGPLKSALLRMQAQILANT